VVTIRGLTLNGLGGNDGIIFNSGAALYVQDSVFKNLSTDGINANPGANLVVEDSLFTRTGNGGVFLQAGSGTIEHCRFEDGGYGVLAGSSSNVVVRDSVASGNSHAGFYATTSGSHVDVENSLLTHNNTGLAANIGGMRVSETTIEENTTGVVEFNAGTIASFGNNRLAGNATNGSFSPTIPLQ